MIALRTLLIVALLAPGALLAQEPMECRVLVAKEWISMGAASLTGCFKFADEAATQGERQFAKLGNTFLKVQGAQHFQSSDGGNTWEPVVASEATSAFQSLNVLEPPDNEIRQIAPEAKRAPAKKKKRRRVRRPQ